METNLSTQQFDRALGCIIGSASGDALGSAYEFGPSWPDSWKPTFGAGVFGHGVGEWTDDTAMAMPILEWAAARGEKPLRHILERWIEWSQDAKDVGAQTRAILSRLDRTSQALEGEAFWLAKTLHENAGQSAGNGSLMRIGPFALAYLSSEAVDLTVLKSVVQWTHFEEDNFIAAALWSDVIRSAILTGKFSMQESLQVIGEGGNERWLAIIQEALTGDPRDFKDSNGWVVSAFQAALSAVTHSKSLEDAIESAIRGGGDTDTVAAIAGSLAGAFYGLSGVPRKWISLIHGWPGYSFNEVSELVREATALPVSESSKQ